MATVPILEIPIDDSQFEAFRAAFEGWQENVKKLPKDWQAVNSKIIELARLHRQSGAEAGAAWSKAVSLVGQYDKAVRDATNAEKALGHSAGGTSKFFGTMAKDAKSVAGHLFSTTKHLAKIATYGIGGGLLGLGGLSFGLDKLADTVVGRQRSARGLGITSGQLASFTTNFAPFAGVNVLQGAAEAQVDASKAGWFATLGINPQKAANESATALAEQEIMAVHNRLRGVSNNVLLNTSTALAAEHLGMSAEDIRRIHGTRAATLALASAETNRDSNELGFSPAVAREWRNFSVQLHKAGILIEAALINTLAPLAQPNALPALSREIAKFITDLGKSGEVKAAVAGLSAGIKNFAAWIGSPEVHRGLRTFAADVSDVAEGLANALRWLGLIPASETQKLRRLSREQSMESPEIAAARNSVVPGEAEAVRQAINSRVQRSSVTDVMADIRQSAAKYGIDPAFATKIAASESSLGQAKMLVSSEGAIGVMQLEPGTAKDLGVNPYRTRQNIKGGIKYIAELKRHFHGNMQEVAAAYNWGFGNVDRDIKAHGAHWFAFMPKEVRQYVANNAGLSPGETLASNAPPPTVVRNAPPVFPGGSHGTTTAAARGALPPRLSPGTLPPLTHVTVGNAPPETPLRSGSSDIARVRSRHWQTHSAPKIRVENNSGSQVFLSANAAAP